MGYISNFSPDGKLFSLLDSVGRLVIWNVQKNEIIMEHDPNPNSQYTCFIWFKNCNKHLRRHSETNKNNGDKSMLMALGTNQGRIDVYCYATNKVKNFLNDENHQSVTSLCWHKNTLYTSDKCGRIFKWELMERKAEQHPERITVKDWQTETGIPTLIVSLPMANALLIGCEKLEYWSMEDYRFKFTITEDSVDIKSTKIIEMTDQRQEYILTIATTKPEINLWKARKTNNLIATFLMVCKATFVDCLIVGKGLIIAAIGDAFETASGRVVYLFNVDDIGFLLQHMYPTVKRTVSREAVSLHIQSVDSENIIIRCGNSPKTTYFKNIKCSSNKNGLNASMLIGLLTLPNDGANLRQTVFYNIYDKEAIRSTLMQLPTQYIPRLIDELIEFTRQKLKSVHITVRWLKLLLEIHAQEPTTLTTDELRDRFGLLLTVIENRFSSYVPMTKLKGRLDSVLNLRQLSNWSNVDNHQENLILHEEDSQTHYKSNYFITE